MSGMYERLEQKVVSISPERGSYQRQCFEPAPRPSFVDIGFDIWIGERSPRKVPRIYLHTSTLSALLSMSPRESD